MNFLINLVLYQYFLNELIIDGVLYTQKFNADEPVVKLIEKK
jgi:hypothetical protein